ncbi:MAG: 30S ribosomal protein S8 [Planctomycetota bacterium]|jgi:small subunit ribosomal protein S8
MSMSDPIADMLTSIRNGLQVQRKFVDLPASRVKRAVAGVLQREGYLGDVRDIQGRTGHPALRLFLRYDEDGLPVIQKIGRVSKPGCRIYSGVRDIPRVLNGMGISVLTTSKGILSDREARAAGVGGEILCQVW